jgi:hypothetical protein
MTLLRKWWAPIRARLIDDAGRWWRLWTIRLAAIGTVVTAFVQWFPDTLSRRGTRCLPTCGNICRRRCCIRSR